MAKEMVLMATGDIFLGLPEEYPALPQILPILKKRPDAFSWLEKVAPVLKKADFVLGHLEGPVCRSGQADEGKATAGSVVLRMPPEAVTALKKAGFQALALANNHSMDMGGEGIVQTVEYLEKSGVKFAGGGRDIDEARRPAIVEKGGVRVALLSYTSVFLPGSFPAGPGKPGLATVAVATSYQVPNNVRYSPGVPPRVVTTAERRDAEQVITDVRQAKAQADIVVVNWHWGATRYANSMAMGLALDESPFFVFNYQEDMGRAVIDAGADLVMGHHPARFQGMEVYKNRLICYAVPRLAFSFNEAVNFGPESAIIKACFDTEKKKISRFTLIPVKFAADGMEPYRVPIKEAADFIPLLEKASKKYGTAFKIDGEEIAVRKGK